MLNQALAQQRQSEDPQALYRAMMLPQANAAMNAQPEPEPELDVEVEVEVEPDRTENQVGIKPSAADRTLYVGAHRSMTMLDDLMATANGFSKKQNQQADSPLEVAIYDYLPQDFARIAREKQVYKDKDVRNFMSRGAKLESDFSKLMAGLNLTQFEIIDRQKWSPFANGISQDARKDRMVDLKKILVEQTNIFNSVYGEKWGKAVQRGKDKTQGNANRTILAGLTDDGLAEEAEDILAELRGA
tara:strand:- start:1685 stop:2416 length:732 start_codon:yes stop_codon:yes gene_type:complete